MIINEEYKKLMKDLEDFRGFSEEEWRFLNGDLKTLIGLRTHIVGKGSKLFKCIIGVLTDHEKRLEELEKHNLEYHGINESGGITNIKIIRTGKIKKKGGK